MCQPLTYKVSGSLPKGLKFKDGVLSGTPKAAVNGSFAVTAKDLVGHSRELNVVVRIRPLPSWLAGESRAMLYDATESGTAAAKDGATAFEVMGGLLELSVTSAGKASAKVQTEGGKASLVPALEWRPG